MVELFRLRPNFLSFFFFFVPNNKGVSSDFRLILQDLFKLLCPYIDLFVFIKNINAVTCLCLVLVEVSGRSYSTPHDGAHLTAWFTDDN